ncbi:hypothetical protein [uncultured Abyssibacter sp.]|uniref:hypothetical protein n=1 Tax=uncultured Abyssibacter sp. TaxID=2320202 RepID=UPI0032B19BCB
MTYRFLLAALLAFGCALPAAAEDASAATDVTVRVRAHDAKFIGSGVGGLEVIFENAETGAWLASGQITGGTGDTDLLMRKPQQRGERLAPQADTAACTASLPLTKPTRVRIRVTGPQQMAQPASLSVTTWVVPGHPIDGDGLVLNLPGLIVTADPMPSKGGELPLRATVTLMCGCPLTEGGLWDTADYEVMARVERPDGSVSAVPLSFTGEPNHFAGMLPVKQQGRHLVTIWAHNAGTGNTGAADYTVDVP